MSKPASREQLKDYCMRRLGFPVIDINVDEDQVEDRVDDALQVYAEYHFDGTEKTYFPYKVTAGDIANSYISIPDSILGVTRILPISSESIASNSRENFNMFDLNYQMRLNELYDFTSSSYQYYWIARSHIRMLDMLLTGENPVRFNKKQNRLYIDMNWKFPEVPADKYIMIECLRVLDPNEYTDVYNDAWLKEYTTCLIKEQWGRNLTKYGNYSLPGGMVINGESILQDAIADKMRLEEKLRDSLEEPPVFEVG